MRSRFTIFANQIKQAAVQHSQAVTAKVRQTADKHSEKIDKGLPIFLFSYWAMAAGSTAKDQYEAKQARKQKASQRRLG